jgi:hypothetical protein
MKSAGKARNNGLYRHIRTSKEIIRNLLNDLPNNNKESTFPINSITQKFFSARKRLNEEKSNNRAIRGCLSVN